MIENTELLDDIITGYIPHKIYAFSTPQLEGYLKVGETGRSVNLRLNEWRRVINDLTLEKEWLASLPINVVDQESFFQDFALHKFFKEEKQLEPINSALAPGNSKEFYPVTIEIIEEGIKEIGLDYESEPPRRYNYLSIEDNSKVEEHWARNENFPPRDNQQRVIDNIVSVSKDEDVPKNYLLFAVMRFGKTFVALEAAKKLNSRLTVIVTAKTDVEQEWKKTLESHVDFDGYEFLNSKSLVDNNKIIRDKLNEEKKVVLFLSLQDLQGEKIKEKHKQVFDEQVDLLIVDETHFGARAQNYGQVIQTLRNQKRKSANNEEIVGDDYEDNREVVALKQLKKINSKYTLHLSGTPYRVLMGNEFKNPKQLVGKVQFEDILEEKEKWFQENLNKPEWENPYFGFPQMVRFAFQLSQETQRKINALRSEGKLSHLNELFGPLSQDSTQLNHKIFKHEQEVLNLLKSLDGTEISDVIFPILNYERIKEGKMANHIVMVLPFKASCDAMEELLIKYSNNFNNLKDYEIINIAGHDTRYSQDNSTELVKEKIREAAIDGRKTISLTVNKMMTGVTVPQWDTMIFLKDTQSPQEYDQAVYRLQSPNVTKQLDEVGNVINKIDLKPQTLLIDFSPNRMMSMEQYKAFIFSSSEGEVGNENVAKKLDRQMSFSPIITLNSEKLTQVKPNDILKFIAAYSSEKGIIEEASEIAVDLSIIENDTIKNAIENENEIGIKSGLKFERYEHGDKEVGEEDLEDTGEDSNKEDTGTKPQTPDNPNNEDSADASTEDKIVKKIQNYYLRLLFFSFLSKEKTTNSLSDLINIFDNNKRLAKHLGIDKKVVIAISEELKNPFVRSELDNKISNANALLADESIQDSEKITRAIQSFNRISENEIFTPNDLATITVERLFSDANLYDFNNNPKRIIDITSKSGIYLVLICIKLRNLGVSEEKIKQNLFAVTTSTIAYEFTRKAFELLKLDTNNIVDIDTASSYDLIDSDLDVVKKNLNCAYRNRIEDMKFDVVIGNPPYQEEAKGESSSDDPIYNKFMELGYNLAPRAVFVTPGRFLFNAGKTPKSWNKKMLEDKHLEVVYYERDSNKVFGGTSIPGGIVITDRNLNIEVEPIKEFFGFQELKDIKDKVWLKAKSNLSTMIYTQNKFNLSDLYQDFPEYRKIIGSNGKDKRFRQIIMERLEVFTEEKNSNTDIRVRGLINRKRSYRYISRKYVEQVDWIDKYKVIVPFSNGASGTLGDQPARLISKPEISMKGDGITQSFIGIGQFDTLLEAENLYKYINTKFARVMLGILKVTQGNKAETWKYVPQMDFKINNEIDWTLPLPQIDKQLYNYFNLEPKEILFIESKVSYI